MAHNDTGSSESAARRSAGDTVSQNDHASGIGASRLSGIRRPSSDERLIETSYRHVLADTGAAGVIVDADFEILHMNGELDAYLTVAPGAPTRHLLTLARCGLRSALRTLIESLPETESAVRDTQARVLRGRDFHGVEITARRLAPAGCDARYVLVILRDAEPGAAKTRATVADGRASASQDSDVIVRFEDELRALREELRAAADELEAVNEELARARAESRAADQERRSAQHVRRSLDAALATATEALEHKTREIETAGNDLLNLYDSTDIATIFLDKQGRIKRFTPAIRNLFDLAPSDAGRPVGDIPSRILGPVDLDGDARDVLARLRPMETEEATDDGRWFFRRITPYRTADDWIEGVVLTFTEITSFKRAQHALSVSEARFRGLYHDNPSMYLSLDTQHHVISINQFGARQLGYDEAELVGRAFIDLHPDREQLERELACCVRTPGQAHRWESRLRRRDASQLWVRANARQVEDENGEPMILLACDDISEQKRLSEEVQFQATHDGLTGLVNRREIERRLTRTVDNAHRRGGVHALCFIDLDNFKVVNDTYGHHAGDELLRQLADQMEAAIRRRDVLARLGGDEFALLLEHCAIADAERIARNLIAAITRHEFLWEDCRLHIGCCIGVVPIGTRSGTMEDVLRAADAACFAAKELGPGTLHLYAEDDSLVMRRRTEMSWADQLRKALHDDRIEVLAQPIAALSDGRICGFETLARIRDVDGELLGPDRFIDAALRYGLIREIDMVALRKTLAFLAAHKQTLRPFDWIAVNIAGASLTHPGFVDAALEAIRSADVDPTLLCFEITETSVISNLSQARRFIAEFQALGCHFALDDFGMGLSSFHYLRVLPVDYIKIDGSFIRDVLNDRADRAMVEAINQIAHLMRKMTVAEYVENQALRRAAYDLGIDYGQGFHYGGALPLSQALLVAEMPPIDARGPGAPDRG